MRKISSEVIIGGVFGVVSIFASMIQMGVNGYTADAIVGSIKDISGTMVTVMVLIIAIRSFIVNRPQNLHDLLMDSFERFEDVNLPLIFYVKGFVQAKDEPYVQGFSILQDFSKFPDLCSSVTKGSSEYDKYAKYGRGGGTGKFIDLPATDVMLKDRFLVKFTFLSSSVYDEDYKQKIISAISAKFGGVTTVMRSNHFTVEVPRIESKEDINRFIELLNFVIVLYQIGNKGMKHRNDD